MIANARIADLIRENKPDEITEAIAEGDFFQMQTFSKALIQLVARGEGRPRGRRQRRLEPPRLPHRARPRAQGADRRGRRASRPGRRARGAPSPRRAAEPEPAAEDGRRGRAAEAPRRRPAVAMRRLLPLLGAVLVLALALSSTAGADTFRVARSAHERRRRRRPRSRRVEHDRHPLHARRRAARCPSPRCAASGRRPATPTASPGRCSPRSTRSRRTSGRTSGRARPEPSAGCSSCPRPGRAGASTRTATASPTPTTPPTRSSAPRATSPAAADSSTSRARSTATTTQPGT